MDAEFAAVLCEQPIEGGWTYLAWRESVAHFSIRGRVKIRGTIDGHSFRNSVTASRCPEAMGHLRAPDRWVRP
ncbi:DUF1905 domain-containing protein [Streptomyces sp. NPDC059862]|uniref:DUF1905 domain-containing protein n=1 Tax=unclassified Streptomyces TaxID=2593676 RepID=UPI00363CC688